MKYEMGNKGECPTTKSTKSAKGEGGAIKIKIMIMSKRVLGRGG
jgi:hypothetical protein